LGGLWFGRVHAGGAVRSARLLVERLEEQLAGLLGGTPGHHHCHLYTVHRPRPGSRGLEYSQGTTRRGLRGVQHAPVKTCRI
jgi:hypothetical protein